MGKAKCRPCVPSPPRPVIPTWADPLLSLFTTAYRYSTVAMVMGTDVELCRADPRRVMLGVFGPSGVAMTANPRPQAMETAHSFAAGFNVGWLWFSLFDYGVIVTDAWRGVNSGNQTIGIVEVYRI